MKKVLAGTIALSMLAAGPVHAQSVTINDTMAICTAVIAEQYASDEEPLPRWGECIAAVEAYVAAVGAISPSADPLIGELIVALVELYRDDNECKIRETELPIAINTAAAATSEEVLKAEYVLIAEQVLSCDIGGTAAITPTPELAASGA